MAHRARLRQLHLLHRDEDGRGSLGHLGHRHLGQRRHGIEVANQAHHLAHGGGDGQRVARRKRQRVTGHHLRRRQHIRPGLPLRQRERRHHDGAALPLQRLHPQGGEGGQRIRERHRPRPHHPEREGDTLRAERQLGVQRLGRPHLRPLQEVPLPGHRRRHHLPAERRRALRRLAAHPGHRQHLRGQQHDEQGVARGQRRLRLRPGRGPVGRDAQERAVHGLLGQRKQHPTDHRRRDQRPHRSLRQKLRHLGRTPREQLYGL